MNNLIKLILSVALPLAVGAVAGIFTASSVNSWYSTLNKPFFNPPDWLFAPVWTTLYILMGIAFYFIWKSSANRDIKTNAIVLYLVQLIVNFAWSFLFFYFQQVGLAMLDIMLLWILIAGTIFWFGKIEKVSAWLLVPYLCWVSFAMVLNFAIWQFN